MANGQPISNRDLDATRNHLCGHISDAKPAVDALVVSLEMMVNAGVMPAGHLHIAVYIADALADLHDRVEHHLTPVEVDRAA